MCGVCVPAMSSGMGREAPASELVRTLSFQNVFLAVWGSCSHGDLSPSFSRGSPTLIHFRVHYGYLRTLPDTPWPSDIRVLLGHFSWKWTFMCLSHLLEFGGWCQEGIALSHFRNSASSFGWQERQEEKRKKKIISCFKIRLPNTSCFLESSICSSEIWCCFSLISGFRLI